MTEIDDFLRMRQKTQAGTRPSDEKSNRGDCTSKNPFDPEKSVNLPNSQVC